MAVLGLQGSWARWTTPENLEETPSAPTQTFASYSFSYKSLSRNSNLGYSTPPAWGTNDSILLGKISKVERLSLRPLSLLGLLRLFCSLRFWLELRQEHGVKADSGEVVF
jgi:hypothetical protein